MGESTVLGEMISKKRGPLSERGSYVRGRIQCANGGGSLTSEHRRCTHRTVGNLKYTSTQKDGGGGFVVDVIL